MDLGLADRAFLVTAASTGLGRATAEQLVAEGARVVLVARRAELLAEAVSQLGPDRAVALAADLTDAGTAETACALALDAFGRLDGALISVGGPARRIGARHQRGAVAQRVRLGVSGSAAGQRRGGAGTAQPATCALPGCCRPL